ncbi:YfbM family protein [Streptococcus oralis]|uniref:YfbM family protein n=1 Tax=Streptococcus jiangnanensis TaxID=3095079 RepID=A0ABU5G1K9_9STRE|nr:MULTISPECIES: YfbM family protein [Streptococcus]MBN6011137.1 YfbM family protein [Streptococcus oralis subsp. oralis]MCP9037124.1 YfbM family protein [Streptococcus oralis]MCP9052230.1 YfbM family protein [Streptococcus oralis]MCP9058354.1 YfbM family protein [Streptococcus oralis]MCP9066179.1 YfbM family protein [Streptococcus oralis]
MGIIANYQYLSDNELSQIVPDSRQEEELFDLVEDSTNENETLIDIDKMWDALLFVMTGFSSSEFMDGDPLREAVLRVTPLEEVSEYIAYTEKNKIAEIVEALESFDMDRALADFSMETCKKADLYPDIWDYLDEEEEIKDDIRSSFIKVKDFYKKILDLKGNVLVTIC